MSTVNLGELLDCIEPFDSLIGGVSQARAELGPEILESPVEEVLHDSREVKQNSLFVALSGTSHDSHEFISEARAQGAAAIIGEHASSTGDVPDILVKNSRAVLGPASAALAQFPSVDLKLVGITGTNGKTTVSYLYSSMVQAQGESCFTMGTTGILLNGEKESDSQTTPDPLLLQQYFSRFAQEGVTHGALEVSSHALDQCRVLGTEFEAVVYTNFSQDHLDYHETMDEYFAAKMKLFSKTYSTSAVINLDDAFSTRVLEQATNQGMRIVTTSCTRAEADIYVEAIASDITGSDINAHFSSQGESRTISFHTELIGDFNLENIAVALGAAQITGMDLEKACQAMSHPQLVPGRLERSVSKNGFNVFVDYAHTPDALERVINVIKPLAQRTIVVFGCGGDRDVRKRPLMGAIASKLADVAIVTNDNPRTEDPDEIIANITQEMSGDYIVEPDRRKAIEIAIKTAREGDVVLIAGKGHERGQIFREGTQDFSDIEEVVRILSGASQ